MKKAAFLFLLVISIVACGQINKTIIKANAYYVVPTPGTIMVDENRKEMPPPQTKIYTVYLEIKRQVPQWTKAWVDGKSFTLIQGSTVRDSVIAGNRYADGRRIVIKPAKGNALVQLELAPDENHKPSPQKLGANELLLESRLKGNVFFYKITGITQLTSPEYQ